MSPDPQPDHDPGEPPQPTDNSTCFVDDKDLITVVLPERVWVDIDWSFDDILRTG